MNRIAMSRLKEIVRVDPSMSPPIVCLRIMDLLNDQVAGAREFGDLISADPALSAKLLRVVNSAWYGLPSRVETITRAVTMIGTNELALLALSTGVVDRFAGIDPGLVDMDSFWRHSLFVAIASREIGVKAGVLHPERLFVAGLLHDLGHLVLWREYPEQSGAVIETVIRTGVDMEQIENDTCGLTHTMIGGLLAREWRLPEALCHAISGHHEDGRPAIESRIVRAADRLAARTDLGAMLRMDVELPAGDPLSGLPLNDCSSEEIVSRVTEAYADLSRVLFGVDPVT